MPDELSEYDLAPKVIEPCEIPFYYSPIIKKFHPQITNANLDILLKSRSCLTNLLMNQELCDKMKVLVKKIFGIAIFRMSVIFIGQTQRSLLY